MTKLTPVTPKTLRSQIETQLREQIIGGQFEPGRRLTETKLSHELNVSRGPLREAIQQLTEEGLLVKETYKGLSVRSINQKELIELYSMRTNLEQFAFREGWHKRTVSAQEELKKRYERLRKKQRGDSPAAVIHQEIAFHSWIYEISDHSLLQASWKRLSPLLQIYLAMHQKQFGPQCAFMASTQEYLKLACGEDLEAMLQHIEVHLREGLSEILASLPDHNELE